MIGKIKQSIVLICIVFLCSFTCQSSLEEPLNNEEPSSDLSYDFESDTSEIIENKEPFLYVSPENKLLVLAPIDNNDVLAEKFRSDNNMFISLETKPKIYKFDSNGDLIFRKDYLHGPDTGWGKLRNGKMTICSRRHLLNSIYPGAGLSMLGVAYYMLSLVGYQSATTLEFPVEVACLLIDAKLPNVENIILTNCACQKESYKRDLNDALIRFPKLKTLEIKIDATHSLSDQINVVDYGSLTEGLSINIVLERNITARNLTSNNEFWQDLLQAVKDSFEEVELPENATWQIVIDSEANYKSNVCTIFAFIAGTFVFGSLAYLFS